MKYGNILYIYVLFWGMKFGFSQACDTYPTICILSLASSVLLLMHHYYKHRHNLTGTDRFFQSEDVFVLCEHGRFSHEMFVVRC